MSFIGDVYCDLDGVLVDFYNGCHIATGKRLEKLRNGPEKDQVMKIIFDTGPHFWANLLPTHDFHQLWNHIVHWRPYILTAVPTRCGREHVLSNNVIKYAKEGKTEWCDKYIQVPHDKIYVVERNQKADYATSIKSGHVVSNILIDDTADNINHWRANRGIGILHKSATDTIEQLKKVGLL